MDIAQHPSTLQPTWLPPGAALRFFDPPEGIQLDTVVPAQHDTRARYGFRVANLGLLIDPDAGSEVLAMPVITPLPNTPAGFLGLINLRGNLVPIYELHRLLDLDRRPGAAARLLVFGKAERAVGVVIDGYPELLSELQPLPNLPTLLPELRQHAASGFVQDNTVWLEFDYSGFFASLSGSAASQYQDIETN